MEDFSFNSIRIFKIWQQISGSQYDFLPYLKNLKSASFHVKIP